MKLNGKVIKELGLKADLRKDKVTVDNRPIELPSKEELVWILFHKPKNVITSLEDSKQRNTIANYVSLANEKRLVPVGGMDRDATGLLLLTNEVGWIHPLTHHSYKHDQGYVIVLEGRMNDEKLDRIRSYGKGRQQQLEGLPTVSQVLITNLDPQRSLCSLELIMPYGSPHDLLDLFDEIQCELISSRRVQYGPIGLRSLKRGVWRHLTDAEVSKLKASCKKAPLLKPPMVASHSSNSSTVLPTTQKPSQLPPQPVPVVQQPAAPQQPPQKKTLATPLKPSNTTTTTTTTKQIGKKKTIVKARTQLVYGKAGLVSIPIPELPKNFTPIDVNRLNDQIMSEFLAVSKYYSKPMETVFEDEEDDDKTKNKQDGDKSKESLPERKVNFLDYLKRKKQLAAAGTAK